MPHLFGQHRSPQRDPHESIVGVLQGSLIGPAGMAASDTTAKPGRTFLGGAVQPQRFVRPTAAPMPNDREAMTGQMPANYRRTLNRGRGSQS